MTGGDSVGKADMRMISRRSFIKSLLKQLRNEYGIRSALDVGSGAGEFCILLKELGMEADGLEKNNNFMAKAGIHGLNVFSGVWPNELPDRISRNYYQLISMNEVVYYFKNLYESLKTAHQQLDENGILFVKYRNIDNVAYTPKADYQKIFGADLIQPTGSSIYQDLEKIGFKVIRWLPYPEDNLTLVKCYLSLLIPQFKRSLEKEAQVAKHTIIIGKKEVGT